MIVELIQRGTSLCTVHTVILKDDAAGIIAVFTSSYYSNVYHFENEVAILGLSSTGTVLGPNSAVHVMGASILEGECQKP